MDCTKKETEELLKAYEPLITKLSYLYYGASESDSLELEDFKQEARIGMINAIASFDESKGTAFSSYIENGMRIALRKLLSESSRLIRFPKHRIEQLKVLEKAEERVDSDDYESLANVSGLSEKKIRFLRSLRSMSRSLSLDEERDETSYLDFIGSEDFSPKVLDDIMLEKIQKGMESLPRNERYILNSFFGSFGEKRKSRSALSEELNMSYASIRRSYERAITTLRKAL